MIIIRCTQKLLKELRHFEVSDCANEVDDSIFGAWYANLLRIDRRKCILMTNEKSLFTFLIPSVKKKDFINLKDLFIESLFENLSLLGIILPRSNSLIDIKSELKITKTSNKSILGSMSDYANNYRYLIADSGGLEFADLNSITMDINIMPMSALNYSDGKTELLKQLKIII